MSRLLFLLLVLSISSLAAQAIAQPAKQENVPFVNEPKEIPDQWKQLPNTPVVFFADGDFGLLKSQIGVSGVQVFRLISQRLDADESVNGLEQLVSGSTGFRMGCSAISFASLRDLEAQIACPEMFYCRFFFSATDPIERDKIVKSFLSKQNVGAGENFTWHDSSVFPVVRGNSTVLWGSFDKENSFVIATPAFFAHQKKDFSKVLRSMFGPKSKSRALGLFADLNDGNEDLFLRQIKVEVLAGKSLVRADLQGEGINDIEGQLGQLSKVAKSEPDLLVKQVSELSGVSAKTSNVIIELLSVLQANKTASRLEVSIPSSTQKSLKLILENLAPSERGRGDAAVEAVEE